MDIALERSGKTKEDIDGASPIFFFFLRVKINNFFRKKWLPPPSPKKANSLKQHFFKLKPFEKIFMENIQTFFRNKKFRKKDRFISIYPQLYLRQFLIWSQNSFVFESISLTFFFLKAYVFYFLLFEELF